MTPTVAICSWRRRGQRPLARHGEVLGRVSLTHSAIIFTKGTIKHPPRVVLDAPVALDRRPELLGIARHAAEVVADLLGGRVSDRPLYLNHRDASRPRPAPLGIHLRQRRRVPDGPAAPLLDPPMSSLLDRPTRIVGDAAMPVRLGISNHLSHGLRSGRLVALQRQHVVGFLIADGLGDRGLAADRVHGHAVPRQRQQVQRRQQGGDRLCLAEEALLELAGVEGGEDAPKGVM